MKLAVCLEYSIRLRGGVSVLVEALLLELHRLGYDIVLVSDDTPETIKSYDATKHVRHFIPWSFQQPSRSGALRFAENLKAQNIGIAHFHHGGTFGWGNRFPFQSPIVHLSRLGVPCVSTVHRAASLLDGFCGPQRSLLYKLCMLPLAWTGKCHQLAHTRYEIVVSQKNLYSLRSWYWPFRNRFVQIYHSRLHENEARRESAREPFILNVGHLTLEKGQSLLAQAFAKVAADFPEWKLVFAGHDQTGESTQQIRRVMTEHGLGDRILLEGERSDVQQLMLRAGLYVQPSLSEALGLALQEAMFHGCAAVGSRTGGIPELIDNEKNGILVEPGNIDELAIVLRNLLSNPARRETLGRAAAESIRKKGMTAESMAARYHQLYQSLSYGR